MPRTLKAAEKNARAEHFEQFPKCWLCKFLNRSQSGKTELHHVAGRGKTHEVRENYAALCTGCHKAIQSRKQAELLCLALIKQFNREHYSPRTICELRQRPETCWTDLDVEQCSRVMELMREATR